MTRLPGVVGAAVLLVGAGLAPAQEAGPRDARRGDAPAPNANPAAAAPAAAADGFGTQPRLVRLSKLIGAGVALREGTGRTGVIRDAVVGPDGSIDYLIISNGDRMAVVPWNVATLNYGERIVTLNATPAMLDMVAFGEADWPTILSSPFTDRIARAYGAEVVPAHLRSNVAAGGVAADGATDPSGRPNVPDRAVGAVPRLPRPANGAPGPVVDPRVNPAANSNLNPNAQLNRPGVGPTAGTGAGAGGGVLVPTPGNVAPAQPVAPGGLPAGAAPNEGARPFAGPGGASEPGGAGPPAGP
jgi:hypothetical protein